MIDGVVNYVGHEDAVVDADESAAPHLDGEARASARVTRLQLGRARVVVQHQESPHRATCRHPNITTTPSRVIIHPISIRIHLYINTHTHTHTFIFIYVRGWVRALWGWLNLSPPLPSPADRWQHR